MGDVIDQAPNPPNPPNPSQGLSSSLYNYYYVHPDDQTQPTFEMTPELKPFTHHVLFKEQDGSVL